MPTLTAKPYNNIQNKKSAFTGGFFYALADFAALYFVFKVPASLLYAPAV